MSTNVHFIYNRSEGLQRLVPKLTYGSLAKKLQHCDIQVVEQNMHLWSIILSYEHGASVVN